MSRPDKLPSWVDDDSATKLTEPSSTKKLQGWLYKERPAFDFWNWITRNFVKWILHLDVSVNHFDPHEAATPNMTVVLTAGKVQNGITLTSVAEQTTALFVAPVSNPRIDRVVVDNVTGVYSVIAGAEAASPVAPALTIGKIAICQVLLDNSPATTEITNDLITDERASNPFPAGLILTSPVINTQVTGTAIETTTLTTSTTKVPASSLVYAKTAGLNTLPPIAIGDWNMDTDVSPAVSPSHGLVLSKIRVFAVSIIDDSGKTYTFAAINGAETTEQSAHATTTVIALRRATGGVFDAAAFSATSFNRGWITIQYVD